MHIFSQLFMAVLWTVHEILMAFFYYDLTESDIMGDEQSDTNGNSRSSSYDSLMPDTTTEKPVASSSWKEMAMGRANATFFV